MLAAKVWRFSNLPNTYEKLIPKDRFLYLQPNPAYMSFRPPSPWMFWLNVVLALPEMRSLYNMSYPTSDFSVKPKEKKSCLYKRRAITK